MYVASRIARGALGLAAAGWLALSLSGCAPSAIDAERSSFIQPPATGARSATGAQLSLVHDQARYGLQLAAGAAPRPAASRGTFHEAYRRWAEGKVRELPDVSQTASQAGQ